MDPPELQSLRQEADGAVEAADEFRREPLHRRVVDHRQAVGNQMRRGQHVAEVMAHLGNGKAQGREPALLLQHGGEFRLQIVEFGFGKPDLVAPA